MKLRQLAFYLVLLLSGGCLFPHNSIAIEVYDRDGNLIGDFNFNNGANQTDVVLTNAVLTNINFGSINFTRAQFDGADLTDSWFSGCTLTDADFSGADLRDVTISDSPVNGAVFNTANLYRLGTARLTGTPASLPADWFMTNSLLLGPGADAISRTLTNLNFAGFNLTNVIFYGADLTDTDLAGADLEGSDFYEATLLRADFSGANGTGARLKFADMSSADLTGADLTRADLESATLNNTIFSNATMTRLRGVRATGNPIGLPPAWVMTDHALGLVGPTVNLTNVNLSGFSNQYRTDPITLEGADLTDATLVSFNFFEVKFDGADLTDAYLLGQFAGASFSNVVVENAELIFPLARSVIEGLRSGGITGTPLEVDGLDLIGGYLIGDYVDLRGANLDGLNLGSAKLKGVTSGGISGEPASLPAGWLLRDGHLLGMGVSVEGLDLADDDLTGLRAGELGGTPASLPSGWQLYTGYERWLLGPGAQATNANFRDPEFAGYNLQGANLRDLYAPGGALNGANFSGAEIDQSRLFRSYAPGVNFNGVNMSSSLVFEARLDGADFRNAQLVRTSFMRSDLRRADFSGANLFGTQFTGADLSGANFSNTTWDSASTVVYFSDAIYTDQTVLPPGLDPDDEFMIYRASVESVSNQIAALTGQVAAAEALAAERAAETEAVRAAFAAIPGNIIPPASPPRDLTLATNVLAMEVTGENNLHTNIIFLYQGTAFGTEGFAIDYTTFDLSESGFFVMDSGHVERVTLDGVVPVFSPNSSGQMMASVGDSLLAGNFQANVGANSRAGRVDVISKNVTNGAWEVGSTLTAQSPERNAGFGFALSVDGNRVAVSAPVGGPVEVIAFTNGVWTNQATILPPTLLEGLTNRWGEKVLLKQDLLLIGSQGKAPVLGAAQGTVAVFAETNGSWIFKHMMTLPSPSEPGDAALFGVAMAAHGDWVAISSADTSSGGNIAQGQIHLYQWTEGVLQQEQSLGLNDPAITGFGRVLAFNGDGELYSADNQGNIYRILRDASGRMAIMSVDMSGASSVLVEPELLFPASLFAAGNGDIIAIDQTDGIYDGAGEFAGYAPGQAYRITPLASDGDSDGLDDAAELLAGTALDQADTSGDGLRDGEAAQLGLDPATAYTNLITFLSSNPDRLSGVYSLDEIRDAAIGQLVIESSGNKFQLQVDLEETVDALNWTPIALPTNAASVSGSGSINVQVPATNGMRLLRMRGR